MIRDILSHELLNRIVVQGMKSFSVELPSDPIRGLCLPYNCQATLLLMDKSYLAGRYCSRKDTALANDSKAFSFPRSRNDNF